MTSWLRHFDIQKPPFDKDLDSDTLWMPSSRKDLLATMQHALKERGHVLLIGEPGIGKTCLLRALRDSLPSNAYRLTYCHNATLGRRDFYRQLSIALSLKPHATAAAVFFDITTHVEALAEERIHPVFLLDESHLLHQDVIDHLHVLTNYSWDQKPLLSLLLAGLPDLWDRMQLRRNRSLWSRIHTRMRIPDATPADTGEYVEHRWQNVSKSPNPFDSDAVAMIHEAACGHLRDIDRIATGALKRAARKKLKRIDRAIVEAVATQDHATIDSADANDGPRL
jgi:type II secretory pathway predicted ATPase ExeA